MSSRHRLLALLLLASSAAPVRAADTVQANATDPPPFPITTNDFLGVWRDTTTNTALVIDPFYPDEPRKADAIAGRTQNRRTGKAEDWAGIFYAANGDKPAHVSIIRRPHVEEINPNIPQWARDKIVNQLIWTLDLTADETDPFNPVLNGQFYPGEVQWSEDTKAVKVVGKGKPVTIHYQPDPNVEIDGVVAPIIEFDYRGRRPLAHPKVQYLVKGDAFKILVTLPQPLAEKQGLKLPLIFHALSSGNSATVELETNALALKDVIAPYSHQEEIIIADRGHGQDREPLFGLFPPAGGFGPRLDLATKNGEIVEMSAAGATYRFRVFDNVTELALARRVDGINDLMLPLVAKLTKATEKDEIDDLTRRAHMARTALKIAADVRYSTEARLEALDCYLSGDGQYGLLLQPNLGWIPESDPNWSKANAFGTQWLSYDEAIEINGVHTDQERNFWRHSDANSQIRLATTQGVEERGALVRGAAAFSEKAKEALFNFSKETAFSLYDLVVAETGVETALIAFMHVDSHGREVPVGQRVTTVLDWGANKFAAKVFNNVTEHDPIRRTISKAGPQQNVQMTPALGAGLPDDMQPGVWQRTRAVSTPVGDAKPTITGKFMPAVKDKPKIEADIPFFEGCRYPGNPRSAFRSDPTGTLSRGEKVLGFDETEFQQVDRKSCVAAATAEGLRDITQDDIIDEVIEARNPPLIGPDRPALENGIRLEELSKVLTKNGYASVLLARDPHKNVFSEIRESFNKGMAVVVGLKLPPPRGGLKPQYHAVGIKGFDSDKSGRFSAIRVYDPAPGEEQSYSPQEFANRFNGWAQSKLLGEPVAIAIQRK